MKTSTSHKGEGGFERKGILTEAEEEGTSKKGCYLFVFMYYCTPGRVLPESWDK